MEQVFYSTHNEHPIHYAGSSLKGRVICTFPQLLDAFGKPMRLRKDDKVDAQWAICFADEGIGTIYNWKNGQNYLGLEGLKPEDITEWNIGGFSGHVLNGVSRALNLEVESRW